MQQSGTAATQYVVVICYLLKLNQQNHNNVDLDTEIIKNHREHRENSLFTL